MLIKGADFYFGARLYVGASLMFFFIWFMMYLFVGLYMLGGDTMFYVSFIVSCFTCDTLVIYLYYEVIHGMSFYFSIL